MSPTPPSSNDGSAGGWQTRQIHCPNTDCHQFSDAHMEHRFLVSMVASPCRIFRAVPLPMSNPFRVYSGNLDRPPARALIASLYIQIGYGVSRFTEPAYRPSAGIIHAMPCTIFLVPLVQEFLRKGTIRLSFPYSLYRQNEGADSGIQACRDRRQTL